MKDVRISYGNVEAVHGIDIDVDQGKIVTLLGANGAGKTTTLRAISGLIRPRSGKIHLSDADITSLPAHQIVNRGVAHVPEGRKVFSTLTVEENLKLGAYRYRNQPGRSAQFMKRVYTLFPRLEERRNQLAGTLSGGEQQMLAMGRGLMAEPEIMLLDEPSLGLAPKLVQDIFRVVQEINKQGVTILLVEQNARMALRISDYAYVLETGRVALSGPAQELRRDPRVKKAYLGER